MINQDFKLTDSMVKEFASKGFIKLKNFLSTQATDTIRVQLNKQLGNEKPTGWYGDDLNRLKYDIGNNSETILQLFKDSRFSNTLSDLTKHSILFTQGIGFELKKNQDAGLPWHVETVSYCFQRMEDFACTLWIPLDPIKPAEQGGGLSYIPKDVFSGKFMFQYREMLAAYLRNCEASETPVDEKWVGHLKSFIPKSEELAGILNKQGQADDFDVGDVFIFDKFVFHRSLPLNEGPMVTRQAYAMRFIDCHSRYDKSRAQNSLYFRNKLNYNPSGFAHQVCQHNGEAIIDSPLFDGTRDRRVAWYQGDQLHKQQAKQL